VIDVLEADHAADARSERQRRQEDGLGPFALDDDGFSGRDLRVDLGLADAQRSAGLDDDSPGAAQRDRLVGIADATLDGVREADQVGRRVVDPDIDDLGVEDRLDPVADEVVHGLHVELLGEAALDVVDQGQLGGPLVRLGEQAPGLVEQAGVLESDAHARRERREQALVGLGVGVLLEPFQGHDAGHPLAAHDRDAEEGLGVGPADLDRAERHRFLVGADPHRALRLDDP
jgi:hypothetical protein